MNILAMPYTDTHMHARNNEKEMRTQLNAYSVHTSRLRNLCIVVYCKIVAQLMLMLYLSSLLLYRFFFWTNSLPTRMKLKMEAKLQNTRISTIYLITLLLKSKKIIFYSSRFPPIRRIVVLFIE